MIRIEQCLTSEPEVLSSMYITKVIPSFITIISRPVDIVDFAQGLK